MKKISTFMVALGVLFMGTIMLNPMAEARMGRPDCPNYRGMSALPELTEEQNKKLNGLFEEHQTTMGQIHQKLVEKEAELRLATVSEKPDAQKITTISKDIGELRGQIITARMAFDNKLSQEGFDNIRRSGRFGGDCFMGGEGRGRGYGHGYEHGYHGKGRGMGRGYHGNGYHGSGQGMGYNR